jgi:site-specific recombinase XerD
MSRTKPNPLLRLVESFFRDHLERMRGVSPHTIRAYRDALRLLFIFAADKSRRDVADLQLTDLHVETVKAFLVHLESHRGNKAATRNYRLAAIRSFFKHLVRNDPTHADQYHRALTLQSKKTHPSIAQYFEPEDMRAILKQPDGRSAQGLRDNALLSFMYNTGARVAEVLAVRLQDLSLPYPKQVVLHGKGKKERICPLWRETVTALQRLSTVREGQPGDLIFRNRRGEPLTRNGVAYILEKYKTLAAHKVPSLKRRHVAPHLVRHSAAVGLLQGGASVADIRDILGHSSIATTSRYLTTNLQMKREALEAFWRRAGISPKRSTPWKPTPDLLAFLDTL